MSTRVGFTVWCMVGSAIFVGFASASLAWGVAALLAFFALAGIIELAIDMRDR